MASFCLLGCVLSICLNGFLRIMMQSGSYLAFRMCWYSVGVLGIALQVFDVMPHRN